MKTNFLKSILFFVLTAGILSSCVNDDDYNTPSLEDFDCIAADSLVATKTVQQIFDGATALPVNYTADDIIEAYIVSSDKGGNFFKSMHLQALDNSVAFTVYLDLANYATHFQVGRKVYIKLKGLDVQIKDGGLLIGTLDGNSIFRIAAPFVKTNILRTCELAVDEEPLVQHITIEEAITNNTYLNKLVEFDNVQFTSNAVGQPYHLPANGTSGTNHTITDQNGKTIIVRSTSFSKYAVKPVPEESGKIRGILTRFGTTYQFTPRFESDIKLTEPRFHVNTYVGGTDIQFLGSFTENFESYPITNPLFTAFPKYINDYISNSRYWQLKQFPSGTGNKFIEMTAFAGSGNPGVEGKTYFFVPVDFTAANTFSFTKEFRFMAGEALKVYYVTSENYTAGGAININNFVNITSSFTGLTYPATGQSQNTFTTAGTYTIPGSLTGNGFFVFEYSGTTAVTTTVQIDDITVN